VPPRPGRCGRRTRAGGRPRVPSAGGTAVRSCPRSGPGGQRLQPPPRRRWRADGCRSAGNAGTRTARSRQAAVRPARSRGMPAASRGDTEAVLLQRHDSRLQHVFIRQRAKSVRNGSRAHLQVLHDAVSWLVECPEATRHEGERLSLVPVISRTTETGTSCGQPAITVNLRLHGDRGQLRFDDQLGAMVVGVALHSAN
jgi:hypothetical protein